MYLSKCANFKDWEFVKYFFLDTTVEKFFVIASFAVT